MRPILRLSFDILSFDMAPSGPGAPRTHGTFEERWLDHMVPLRHPTGRRGSPRPQARREATGRPIVVQTTTPLNTRPAQMCTYSSMDFLGHRDAGADRSTRMSLVGTLETYRCVEEMSEFEASGNARAEFFLV